MEDFLALSHTAWSCQYDETRRQFPCDQCQSVNFWSENYESTVINSRRHAATVQLSSNPPHPSPAAPRDWSASSSRNLGGGGGWFINSQTRQRGR